MAASERPLANVTVELLPTEKVKIHGDTTFKEIYSSILSKPENVTLVSSDAASSYAQQSNQGQQAGGPVTQPKHIVVASPYTKGHSLFLIDRVMVCTPIAPYWDIFPTQLITRAFLGLSDGDKAKVKSAIYFSQTMAGGIPNIMPRVVQDSEPAFSNVWYPLDKGYDTMFGNTVDHEIWKYPGNDDFASIASQLVSSFRLKKNQPFAVIMSVGKYNDAQLGFLEDQFTNYQVNLDSASALTDASGSYGSVASAKSRYSAGTATEDDINTLATHYSIGNNPDTGKPDTAAITAAINKENQPVSGSDDPLKGRVLESSNYCEPAIDIKWANFILTFYKNGQIRLLRDGKQVGDLKLLASDTAIFDRASFYRVIYPLADSIYVFAGDTTTYSSLTGNFVRFDLGSAVSIAESNIIAAFRCGDATFSFSPVVHPYIGELISPPFGTGIVPDSTIVNVHYLGKFGVGNRSTAGAAGSVSFPDANDKNKIYSYLSDCKINWQLKTVGTGQYILDLKLSPNVVPDLGSDQVTFLKSAVNSIYSPAVYLTQITLKNELDDINYESSPIDSCDLLQVSVNQAVESNSASFELNNRDDSKGCNYSTKGKYTHIEGQDNFCGVKPIKIDIKYTGGDSYRVFTGYTSNWKPGRNGPQNSSINISCEDRTKKLREQFAINLPFFDGWCHLATVYYLCKEAGFTDDEILLKQDPRTGAKTTIRSLLQGDPDTFTGGCFDGHMNTNLPVQQAGYSSSFLHMRLPMALMMARESPNYAFQTGTPLWQCCCSVRDFSQWYLYANNWGNIIYGPPKSNIMDTGITFKESDSCNSFYEYVQNLSVDFNTTDTRNMVYAQGLTWIGPKIGETGYESGQWMPHVHIARKQTWPNDTKDHSHAPWRRAIFMRDSKWEDVRLLRLAAGEILRRATRVRSVSQFSSWGHPELFPYDVVTLDESQRNELGINGLQVVIGAHTLNISANDLMLSSNYSCETLDRQAVDYDPNLPMHKRD